MQNLFDESPFPPSFEGAAAFMGDRPSVSLTPTLHVERRQSGSAVAVRYHEVDVVTYLPPTMHVRPMSAYTPAGGLGYDAGPAQTVIFAGNPPHVTASTARVLALYVGAYAMYDRHFRYQLPERRHPVSRHRGGFLLIHRGLSDDAAWRTTPWSGAFPLGLDNRGQPAVHDVGPQGITETVSWPLERLGSCGCRSCRDGYRPWTARAYGPR